MIDAMKVVDFKNYCKHVFFPIIIYWWWKKIFPVENCFNEKLSFNTNDGLLMLYYTIADYSTGI